MFFITDHHIPQHKRLLGSICKHNPVRNCEKLLPNLKASLCPRNRDTFDLTEPHWAPLSASLLQCDPPAVNTTGTLFQRHTTVTNAWGQGGPSLTLLTVTQTKDQGQPHQLHMMKCKQTLGKKNPVTHFSPFSIMRQVINIWINPVWVIPKSVTWKGQMMS